MSNPDVRTLLSHGMGPSLHWFPADVPVSRLASVMVGLANGCGGTILFGIAPRSPQLLGVQDPEKTIDAIFQAALLVDPPLVLPMPGMEILDNRRILVLTIPAGLPNVFNLEGRYLGREGTQTNPLSAKILRNLLMERGVLHFERQIHPDAFIEDLDAEKISEYIRLLHLSETEPIEQVLLKRGCLRRVSDLEKRSEGDQRNKMNGESGQKDVLQPTYAGLLTFAKEPQQWLPNATILMARFAGRSAADSFIKQEIRGTLPDQLRQAEAFLRDNIQSQVRLVGLAHQETPEYPLEAVRELLVNAVAHRDYNIQGDNIHVNLYHDRLEIHSPGNLPGPITLENLLEARFSRNAIVMQLLSDMGFVERLGYGLNRVLEIFRRYQLRKPVFEETAGTFRVTIFRAEDDSQGEKNSRALQILRNVELNPRQEQVLSFLARHRRITNRDYQELCPEVHSETLRRDLVDLVERNLLIKIGDKRATYYVLKSG